MIITQVNYRFALDQVECTCNLFYLAIVKIILRHCHSSLARQQHVLYVRRFTTEPFVL